LLAFGIELDARANLGNMRMKRFSSFIVDGVVKVLNIEESGGGLTCSLSNSLLQQIEQ
jgi:peroxiredoxin